MAERIVIIAGSPGAGKSTIIKELAKRSNCSIANIGTLMLEHAKARGYATDRDKLRFLKSTVISDLRKEALLTINAMPGKVLLDTHASIGENGRYLPGLPIDTLRGLKNVSGLVYIDAVTEDIIERRRKDPHRKRENEDDYMVNEQRIINMSMLSIASSHLNIPLFVVLNRQGHLEECIVEIEKRFSELVG